MGLPSERKYVLAFDQNPGADGYFHENIDTIRKMPIDGTNVDPKVWHPIHGPVSLSQVVWTPTALGKRAFTDARMNLESTNWGSMFHNFLKINMVSPSGWKELPIDWAAPKQVIESTLIANIRDAAELANAVGFDGLWIDLEPANTVAGRKLLNYSDRPFASSINIANYRALVRYWFSRIAEVGQQAYPDITWFLSLFYDQSLTSTSDLTPQGSTGNYGMLAAALDGLHDKANANVEIINWYEAGYEHKSSVEFQRDMDIHRSQRNVSTDRFLVFDISRNTTAQKAEKATAIYIDQFNTAAKFGGAVRNALLYGTERILSMYGQTGLWTTNPPTVAQDYIDAVTAERVTAGMDTAFAPGAVPGLMSDFNPSLITGLADNDPIVTVSDAQSHVFTAAQASGNILYKADGIATGVPALLFDRTGTQYLTGDAVATAFNSYLGIDATSQDWGWTWIGLVAFTAATGASTNVIVSLGLPGQNDLTNFRNDNSGNIGSSRTDHANTTVTVANSGGASTSVQVLTVRNTGQHCDIRINGVTVVAHTSQDVGVMSISGYTFGVNRGAIGSPFGGKLGRNFFYAGGKGIEECLWLERGLGKYGGVTVA